MRRAWIAGWVLAVGAGSCCAQGACSKADETARAAAVAGIRAQMRAVKLANDMDTDVPAAEQSLIPQFKAALAQTAAAVMACHDGAVDAKAVEGELAALLGANPPQPPEGATIANGDKRYAEWLSSEYGSNLLVSVARPQPQLLSVQFQFHIACGQDTVWMVFEQQAGKWKMRLVWQAPPYTEVSGAFGDFFLAAILPGSAGGSWQAVAAHGKPWCTSRFSGFGMDVLRPAAGGGAPAVVWHADRGYSRGDAVPRLRATADGFELRLNNDEMSFNMDGFERAVIYRYRVSGGKVTRAEPIASNARGFVEEWLSMPWDEALAQSDPAQAPALEKVHKQYEARNPEGSNDSTSWGAGPVQACSAPDHFQVTMTTEHQHMVPGKPGGESSAGSTYYFQLRQAAGYRLLAIDSAPDPGCGGGDLMKK